MHRDVHGHSFLGLGQPQDVAVSRAHGVIVVASLAGVWVHKDIKEPPLRHFPASEFGIWRTPVDEDSGIVLSAGRQGLFAIWDLHSGRCLITGRVTTFPTFTMSRRIVKHKAAVCCLGSLAYINLIDGTIHEIGYHQGAISDPFLTNDGRRCFSFAPMGEVKLWDLQERREIGLLRNVCCCAAESFGDGDLIGAKDEQTYHLYRVTASTVDNQAKWERLLTLGRVGIGSLSTSAFGPHMSWYQHESLFINDGSTNNNSPRRIVSSVLGPAPWISESYCLTISRNCILIIDSKTDGVIVSPFYSGAPTNLQILHERREIVSFNPSGCRLFGNDSEPKACSIFDCNITNPTSLKIKDEHNLIVGSARRRFLKCGSQGLDGSVLEIDTGQSAERYEVLGLADDTVQRRLIALCSDGKVRVWSTFPGTPQVVGLHRLTSIKQALYIQHKDILVLSGSEQRWSKAAPLFLMSLRSGEVVELANDSRGPITDIAVSPDNSKLAISVWGRIFGSDGLTDSMSKKGGGLAIVRIEGNFKGSGKVISHWQTENGNASCLSIAYSPTGRRPALGGDHMDKCMYIFTSDDCLRMPMTIRGFLEGIAAIKFHSENVIYGGGVDGLEYVVNLPQVPLR